MSKGGPVRVDIQELITEYSDMVYRLAYAYAGNSFDADEIYQEVFFRLIRKKPDFKGREHAKAWLLRVTINCAKKFLGSSWRKRTVPFESGYSFTEEGEPDLSRQVLSEALQKLREDERLLLHLYYYEEMDGPEIAELLSRRESTVRTQLTRARRALKKQLEEDGYDGF